MPVFAVATRLLLCLCLVAGGWLQAASSTAMAFHAHAPAAAALPVAAVGGSAALTSDCHDESGSMDMDASATDDMSTLAWLQQTPDCCQSQGCQCDCSCPQFPLSLPMLAEGPHTPASSLPSTAGHALAHASVSRLHRPPIA